MSGFVGQYQQQQPATAVAKEAERLQLSLQNFGLRGVGLSRWGEDVGGASAAKSTTTSLRRPSPNWSSTNPASARSSTEILGGPMSFNVIAATGKFYNENPKLVALCRRFKLRAHATIAQPAVQPLPVHQKHGACC
jgi:hypothetical protein